MHTQSDSRTRIVSLVNLQAMCTHVSGTAHTFHVSKVTRSRVHVEYSNPDEYGTARPIVAMFPAIPGYGAGDADNPRIVFEVLRIVGDPDHPDPWQCFITLFEQDPERGFRETRILEPADLCTRCTRCDVDTAKIGPSALAEAVTR